MVEGEWETQASRYGTSKSQGGQVQRGQYGPWHCAVWRYVVTDGSRTYGEQSVTYQLVESLLWGRTR